MLEVDDKTMNKSVFIKKKASDLVCVFKKYIFSNNVQLIINC